MRLGARHTQRAAWVLLAVSAASCGRAGDDLAGSMDAEEFADRRAAMAAAGVTMPETYRSSWLIRIYSDRVVDFARVSGAQGGVVFLGDSITQSGNWAADYPGVTTRNFGIHGDETEGVLARLSQVIDAQPDRVFLMIGTNDLGNANDAPEDIADAVDAIVAALSDGLPDAEVFVQSVLPRGADFDARVRALNARLEALAAAHGAHFVDLFPAFVTADGALDPSVTYDGLHLTRPGYARWNAIIAPCVRGDTVRCEAAQ